MKELNFMTAFALLFGTSEIALANSYRTYNNDFNNYDPYYKQYQSYPRQSQKHGLKQQNNVFIGFKLHKNEKMHFTDSNNEKITNDQYGLGLNFGKNFNNYLKGELEFLVNPKRLGSGLWWPANTVRKHRNLMFSVLFASLLP